MEIDTIVVGNLARQLACRSKCLDGLTCGKTLLIILFIISTVLGTRLLSTELGTKLFWSFFKRLKLRLPDLPSSSWV